ncbi:MAG: hypothetical protein FWE53_02535 [Firmicutes bacterium]|nr:hypothetical protein [Bacillota bacterium]
MVFMGKKSLKLGTLSMMVVGLIAAVAMAGVFAFTPKVNEQMPLSSSVNMNWAGDGSAANPFQIRTATDLTTLATNVNAGQKYEGRFFRQLSDITLTGAFTPIGNSASRVFSGIFEGNGYSIFNLSVNTTSNPAGLFGVIENGSVNGVNLVNANVRSTGSEAGGIAGAITTTDGREIALYNCSVTGKVEGAFNVGGLFGRLETRTSTTGLNGANILVNSCYNNAQVVATGSSNGAQVAGGIAGLVKTGNANSPSGTAEKGGNGGNVTIINNYNRGIVEGSASGTFFSSINGIAGYIITGDGAKGTKGHKGGKGGFWGGKGGTGGQGGQGGSHGMLVIQYNYSTANLIGKTAGAIASYEHGKNGLGGDGGDGGDGGTLFGSRGNQGEAGNAGASRVDSINDNYSTGPAAINTAAATTIGTKQTEAFLKSAGNLPRWDFGGVWTMDSAFTSLNDGFPALKTNMPNYVSISLESNDSSLGSVSGGGLVVRGATVTATATLINQNAQFLGWQENGVIVNTNLTFSFSAAGSRNLRAMFSLEYTINVSAASANGTVSGGGVYTTGQTAYLFAVPNEHYNFAGWEKVGTSGTISMDNPLAVAVNANASYVAKFSAKVYQVAINAISSTPDVSINTVQILAPGTNQPSNGIFNQNSGYATLTASVGAGYAFDGWYEDFVRVSTDLSISVDTSTDRVFMAYFKLISNNFNVELNVVVGNSVTRTFNLSYAGGANVALDPAQFADTAFVGWFEGATLETATAISAGVDSESKRLTFVINENKKLFLKVDPGKVVVTTVSQYVQNGIILSGGGVVDQGSRVDLTYNFNGVAGFDFLGWMESGTIVSTSAVYTIYPNSNRVVTAVFARKSYAIKVTLKNIENPAGSTVVFSSTYTHNATVSLNALALVDASFVKWMEGGAEIAGAGADYSFNATASRDIELWYNPKTITVVASVYQDHALGAGAPVMGTLQQLSGQTWNGNYLTVANTFPTDVQIDLRAVANTGYVFAHWMKNGSVISGATNPNFGVVGAVNGDQYMAVFKPAKITVTVENYLDGAATAVSSYQVDVDFGSTRVVDPFDLGLEAFSTWDLNGNGSQATVSGSMLTLKPTGTTGFTVKANFISKGGSIGNAHTLYFNVYIEVTNGVYQIINSFQRPVADGGTVTVTSGFDKPYKFDRWAQDNANKTEISKSVTYNFTNVKADANYALVLTRDWHWVTLSTYPAAANGTFTKSVTGYQQSGTYVDLTLTCDPAYELAYFTKDGLPLLTTTNEYAVGNNMILIGGNNVFTLRLFQAFNSRDSVVTAVFRKVEVEILALHTSSGLNMLGAEKVYNIGDVITLTANAELENYDYSGFVTVNSNGVAATTAISGAVISSNKQSVTFTITASMLRKNTAGTETDKLGNGRSIIEILFTETYVTIQTYVGLTLENYATDTFGAAKITDVKSGEVIALANGLINSTDIAGYSIWKWVYFKPVANFNEISNLNWDMTSGVTVATSFYSTNIPAKYRDGLILAYFKQMYILDEEFVGFTGPQIAGILGGSAKPIPREVSNPQSVWGIGGSDGSTGLSGAYAPRNDFLFEITVNASALNTHGMDVSIGVTSGGRSGLIALSTYQDGLTSVPSMIFRCVYGELPVVKFTYTKQAVGGASAGLKFSTNNSDAAIISKTMLEGVNVLTAAAADGYRFVGWNVNGVMVSSDSTYTYVNGAGLNVIAIYEPVTTGIPENLKWILVAALIFAISAAIITFAVVRARKSGSADFGVAKVSREKDISNRYGL